MILPLTQGLSALIDDEDYPKIAPYKWYTHKQHKAYYASAKTREGARVRKMLSLGRVILGLTHGDKRHVDHINGNTLDNRKANLRIGSVADNAHNRQVTLYAGVRPATRKGAWEAFIQHKYIGTFPTKEAALHARLEAECKYYGDFKHRRQ